MIESIQMIELTEFLNQVFNSKICVKAWHGNGTVLLLGFGDLVIPDPIMELNPRGKLVARWLASPEYELQTQFSHWSISVSGETGHITSDDPYGEEWRVKILKGARVLSWRLSENSVGMVLNFERGITFEIVPFDLTGEDAAWYLWYPDGHAYGIRCDGRVFKANGHDIP